MTENETLGFRHVFWRDGRARGEGIVTDDITGTGHSYWGWEFWRKTRVLQGDLVVNGVVYPTPAPLYKFHGTDKAGVDGICMDGFRQPTAEKPNMDKKSGGTKLPMCALFCSCPLPSLGTSLLPCSC